MGGAGVGVLKNYQIYHLDNLFLRVDQLRMRNGIGLQSYSQTQRKNGMISSSWLRITMYVPSRFEQKIG